MPNDKKMKRLEALLDSFDSGAVQPEELIQAIEAVMAIIDTNGKTLVDKIVEIKAATDDDVTGLRSELAKTRDNLQSVINQVKDNSDTSVSSVKKALLSEIKRVEALIPVLPPETDLSEVFNEIESQKQSLANLSFLIVGENIRNALESLQGDDRLDKSAIKGIDELEALIKEKASGNQQSFGVRLLRYLMDVNVEGITNGQTLVWNSTSGKFEAGSGGGGGSLTVETPTGTVNGTNVTFTVTTTPKWIVADNTPYYAGWGYSIVGLTVTMELAPNNFIRSHY
jgi:hypothetical protein